MLNTRSSSRIIEHTKINDVNITLIKQKRNNKLDNAIIDFTQTQFDINILLQIYNIDTLNCYPYIIFTHEIDEASKILKQLKLLNDTMFLFDSNTDKQIIEDCMLLASLSKGVSKGTNATRSGQLDKLLLNYVNGLAYDINPKIKAFQPKETGTTNEDIRITYNDKIIFRQENKRISEECNITERFAMVGGKALLNTGQLDDLFVSFIGFNISFLSKITKSPNHFAKAYIEFSLLDQELIISGDITPFETTCIQYPIDINDTSKGLYPGETLKEFYINKLNTINS